MTENFLPGKKFGRLTVRRVIGFEGDHNRQVLCRCDCGNAAVARIDNLRAGKTRSCGCVARELHFARQMATLVKSLDGGDASAYEAECRDLVAAGADQQEEEALVQFISTRGDRTKQVRYRLEPGEYERRLETQKGACNICGGQQSNGGNLVVDHCHTTGRIRGLLCTRCNIGCGAFKDNAAFLLRAAEHLSNS